MDAICVARYRATFVRLQLTDEVPAERQIRAGRGLGGGVLVCAAGISVSGTSTGSALFNNVLKYQPTACTSPEPRSGISVAQSAAAGTRSGRAGSDRRVLGECSASARV